MKYTVSIFVLLILPFYGFSQAIQEAKTFDQYRELFYLHFDSLYNAYRIEKGLKPVKFDSILTERC